MKISEGNELSA